MLSNEEYIAPLSKEIQNESNKLLAVIADTDVKDRAIKDIEGTGGAVSISDLIAYQIGWGNLIVNWYEAGLKNEVPQMPGDGFSTWDYVGLARHFYTKYRFDGYKKQEHAFSDVVKKILIIVEREFETKNLDKEGLWLWCTLPSGKQWPLSKWIRVNTVAPYKRATGLIKKHIKKS